jgi:ZIP family zinc transporter
MAESVVFGVIASSALIIGALVGGRVQFPKRVLAAMLAFAAGALMTALAFELFEDSYEQGGIWRAGIGLLVGAVVFTVISARLDRMAEGEHEEDHGSEKLDVDAAADDEAPSAASVSGAAGLALLAAVTLDGVPRMSRSVSPSVRGVVVSRCLPRSSSPTSGVPRRERVDAGPRTLAVVHSRHVVRVRRAAHRLGGGGAGPLSAASPETLSMPLAFAAGAVLASLADTLMPEAYETGGPTVALSTAAGFVLSFVLATM